MINENIFRAYDIRGKADEDLNDDIIRKIGIVLSEKILKTGQNKVYLGTDCRLSANRIKKLARDFAKSKSIKNHLSLAYVQMF